MEDIASIRPMNYLLTPCFPPYILSENTPILVEDYLMNRET